MAEDNELRLQTQELEMLKTTMEALDEDFKAALAAERKAYDERKARQREYEEAFQRYWARYHDIVLNQTIIEQGKYTRYDDDPRRMVVLKVDADGPRKGVIVKKNGEVGVKELPIYPSATRPWKIVGQLEKPFSWQEVKPRYG